jgi:hypothetical protein
MIDSTDLKRLDASSFMPDIIGKLSVVTFLFCVTGAQRELDLNKEEIDGIASMLGEIKQDFIAIYGAWLEAWDEGRILPLNGRAK